MKHMKMMLSLAMSLVMVLCLSPLALGASAERGMAPAKEAAAKQVVSHVAYAVTEDTDRLIALATRQYYADVRAKGKAVADQGEFTATELAGVTTYADGTIVKEYVATSFLWFDATGSPLSRAARASGSQSGRYSRNDINIVHTMYYTSRSLAGGNQYHINKVTTVVNDVGTDPLYVTSFRHAINCSDMEVTQGIKPATLITKTVTNPVAGQTYTLTNSNSYYYGVQGGAGEVYVKSGVGYIAFSNGYTTGDNAIVVQLDW